MTDPNPAQRRDWFSSNYECVLPHDPDDRTAYLTVIRRDTHTPEWVCVGCHDEGTAWGWWAA